MKINKNSRIFQCINKISTTEIGQLGLACCVTAVIMIMVFGIIQPVFMTIDDARLLYVYAGYATGIPEGNYLFTYYPLSWLIANLYTFAPHVSWYAIYHFAVVFFSGCIVGKTIYKIGIKKKIHIFYLIFLHVFTYLSFYLIDTILMHFEVTATIIGTAGVVLLLGINLENKSKKVIFVELFTSILCIAMCYSQQFNSFYAICCYLIVAVVFLFLNGLAKKICLKTAKYLVTYIVFLFCVIFLIKGIENNAKDTPEWQSYYKYNKYRVSFWDYEHQSYQDNPELFLENGWNEEFYELAENMYFMDKRFNNDALQNIVERFSWLGFAEGSKPFETMRDTFESLFDTERLTLVHVFIILLLFSLLLGRTTMNGTLKIHFPQVLAAFCCVGGTSILMLYLAARGRLPLRAWLACSIPCGVILIILFLTTLEKRKRVSKEKTYTWIIGSVSLVAWGIMMTKTYSEIYHKDWIWRQNAVVTMQEIENYAIEHPTNIFVFDISGAQNYGVFTKYADKEKRPTNLVPWGSSYVFTPVYYDQLKKLGRTSLLTEDLFDENVYYITSMQNPLYKDLLSNMMNHDYDNVSFEENARIGDSTVVYKITKEE